MPRPKQYQLVYEDLLRRLTAGEWAVGDRLPSIAQLQDEYDIRSLNTIRAAQQMLVDLGMLETQQGLGAFVLSTEPSSAIHHVPAAPAAIRLGIRFEIWVEDEVMLGLSREDALGAGLPRAGETIARGALSPLLHRLVGLDPEIHHVDHYVTIPGCRDGRAPLAMLVVQLHGADVDQVLASETALRKEGWHLLHLRRRTPQADPNE